MLIVRACSKPRRTIFITAAIFVMVFIVAGVYLAFRFIDIGYDAKPYDFPRKTVAEKLSPDRRYTAKILYHVSTKNYFFAISGNDGSQLILSKTFIPSSGYHDPLVNIYWKNTETVIIEVDHDFGDANLRYEFNVKRLSFIQL